jgi:hypothetical protein
MPVVAIVPAAPPVVPKGPMPEIGAGILASLQNGDVAAAATIDLRLLGRGAGWGAELAFIAVDRHEQSLDVGRAEWRRLVLKAGVLRRLSTSYLDLDMALDAVSGVLFVKGNGYVAPESSSGMDFGASAAARLAWRLRGVRPWVGVTAGAWLRPQYVDLGGSESRGELPTWELLVGSGLSFSWGP